MSDYDFTSLPPGVIVVRHKDESKLAEFFTNVPEDVANQLHERGYIFIGLAEGFSLERLTKDELKQLGLKRVKED